MPRPGVVVEAVVLERVVPFPSVQHLVFIVPNLFMLRLLEHSNDERLKKDGMRCSVSFTIHVIYLVDVIRYYDHQVEV